MKSSFNLTTRNSQQVYIICTFQSLMIDEYRFHHWKPSIARSQESNPRLLVCETSTHACTRPYNTTKLLFKISCTLCCIGQTNTLSSVIALILQHNNRAFPCSNGILGEYWLIIKVYPILGQTTGTQRYYLLGTYWLRLDPRLVNVESLHWVNIRVIFAEYNKQCRLLTGIVILHFEKLLFC